MAVLEGIGQFMSSKDRKLAVLHQLSQETGPIGLQELLAKLGEGYPERTLRRWLSQLVNEGLVEKLGSTRGARYRVADRGCRQTDSPSRYPRSKRAEIALQVRCSFDEIRARYRQPRRALLRNIILNKRVGAALNEYIHSQSLDLAAKEDRTAFLEDLQEDLREIDGNYIAAFGITAEELKAWMVAQDETRSQP